jgi:glutaminyl-tRNA synthetase
VGATLHWLSQEHARPAEVRLFEYLFTKPDPDEVEEGGSWRDNLNPNSRLVLSKALVEPSLLEAPVGAQFQFERLGYFAVDPDSTPSKPVFNRIVTLKDEWAKVAAKMKG